MKPSEQLPKSHQDLVLKIARFTFCRVRGHIPLEDLTSAGYIGYCEAKKHFVSSRYEGCDLDQAFLHFASRRIRGAILDELRARDELSRNMRRCVKKVVATRQSLVIRLQREPTNEELACAAGISIDELDEVQARLIIRYVSPQTPVLSSAVDDTNHTASPDTLLDAFQTVRRLETALHLLTKRQQFVVTEYYLRERTLKEIGHDLQITESRVSQILSHAVVPLRKAYTETEEAERMIAYERAQRSRDSSYGHFIENDFSVVTDALDTLLRSF